MKHGHPVSSQQRREPRPLFRSCKDACPSSTRLECPTLSSITHPVHGEGNFEDPILDTVLSPLQLVGRGVACRHAGAEDGFQVLRCLINGGASESLTVRLKEQPGGVVIFFLSFASAESAVLRAVVSLVTPLARVRR